MTQVRDDEEARLVEPALNDVASFDALFQRYSSLVYNLAFRFSQNRADADDISQEVWLKVHQRLASLKSPRAFSSWLWQIASHVCLDHARRLRKMEPLSEELATGGSLEDDVLDTDEAQLAWQALACLPPQQKLVLYLREVEGLDYREIASAIGTSVGGIAMSLFRARRQLATSYQELDASAPARCRLSHKLMSALVDDEGDEVSRRALQAHLASCLSCEQMNAVLKRGSRIYGALPVVPSWALRVAGQPFTQSAVSHVSTLAAIGSHLQQVLIPVLATAGLAVASLNLPVVSQNVPVPGGQVEPRTDVLRSGSTGPLVPFVSNGFPVSATFVGVVNPSLSLIVPSALNETSPSSTQSVDALPQTQASATLGSSETEIPGSPSELAPPVPTLPTLPPIQLPTATLPVGPPVTNLLPTLPAPIATLPATNLPGVLPTGSGLLTPGNLPLTLPPVTVPTVPSINLPSVAPAAPPTVPPVSLPSVSLPQLPTVQPGSLADPPVPVRLPIAVSPVAPVVPTLLGQR